MKSLLPTSAGCELAVIAGFILVITAILFAIIRVSIALGWPL